jgi:hypothetical protein
LNVPKSPLKDTPELESSWSRIAGVPIHVAFRESTDIPGAELELEIQRFRSRLDPELVARFLTRPQGLSSERSTQWTLSRACLLSVLGTLEADGSKGLLSLSHCPRASIAAGGLSSASLLGIGVDLESADREISEAAATRFLFAPEKALGLTPLHAWTIKEACFKATPHNANLIVADYVIESVNHSGHSGPAGLGRARCTKNPALTFAFEQRPLGDLVVAFACAQKL